MDLAGVNTFKADNSGPELLDMRWDYRKTEFDTIFGTLSANIRLFRSAIVIGSEESLLAAVQQNEKLNNQRSAAELGRPVYADRLAHSESILIGAKRGILVDYLAAKHIYYVSLDTEHCLSISIDGSGVIQPECYEDAQSAATAMLKSIRIENGNSM